MPLERYSARRDGQDRDRLLFAAPLGDPVGSGNGRFNIGVWTSYDEGRTFINPVQFVDGFSAYSSIKRLHDGRIGLIFEATSSTRIRFLNFDIRHLENQAHPFEVTHYDGFDNSIDRARGGVGWSGSWSGAATFTGDVAAAFGSSSIRFERFPYASSDGRMDLIAGQSAQRNFATPINLDNSNITYVTLLVSRALDVGDDDSGEQLNISLRDGSGSPHITFGVDSSESFFCGAIRQYYYHRP